MLCIVPCHQALAGRYHQIDNELRDIKDFCSPTLLTRNTKHKPNTTYLLRYINKCPPYVRHCDPVAYLVYPWLSLLRQEKPEQLIGGSPHIAAIPASNLMPLGLFFQTATYRPYLIGGFMPVSLLECGTAGDT